MHIAERLYLRLHSAPSLLCPHECPASCLGLGPCCCEGSGREGCLPLIKSVSFVEITSWTTTKVMGLNPGSYQWPETHQPSPWPLKTKMFVATQRRLALSRGLPVLPGEAALVQEVLAQVTACSAQLSLRKPLEGTCRMLSPLDVARQPGRSWSCESTSRDCRGGICTSQYCQDLRSPSSSLPPPPPPPPPPTSVESTGLGPGRTGCRLGALQRFLPEALQGCVV